MICSHISDIRLGRKLAPGNRSTGFCLKCSDECAIFDRHNSRTTVYTIGILLRRIYLVDTFVALDRSIGSGYQSAHNDWIRLTGAYICTCCSREIHLVVVVHNACFGTADAIAAPDADSRCTCFISNSIIRTYNITSLRVDIQCHTALALHSDIGVFNIHRAIVRIDNRTCQNRLSIRCIVFILRIRRCRGEVTHDIYAIGSHQLRSGRLCHTHQDSTQVRTLIMAHIQHQRTLLRSIIGSRSLDSKRTVFDKKSRNCTCLLQTAELSVPCQRLAIEVKSSIFGQRINFCRSVSSITQQLQLTTDFLPISNSGSDVGVVGCADLGDLRRSSSTQ